jgi:hypothetical protein
VVGQRPWHGWLPGAIRERVRAGGWIPGPRHGRDACGAPASRAAATSRLQGWTRATARPLQENGTGVLGWLREGSSTVVARRQQEDGREGRRCSPAGLAGEGLGAVAGRRRWSGLCRTRGYNGVDVRA